MHKYRCLSVSLLTPCICYHVKATTVRGRLSANIRTCLPGFAAIKWDKYKDAKYAHFFVENLTSFHHHTLVMLILYSAP
ncbi:hypothetical protein AHF37_09461 [Paragonimus kellicotti]|nr:hypothetical protein AHF37_09461 [Paragonimus kellicotti]